MHAIALTNAVLLLGAALIIAGILSSLIATRFGAPMLLIFLGVGMLAGEDGPGGIRFSDYNFGNLIGSLALTVILFDGGLRTRFAQFRGVLAPSLLLATLGVSITAILSGLAAYLVLHLAPAECFLLGAIVASTDAAAVFFLLRTGGVQLRARVGAVLEIESGANDPVAVFLTLSTVAAIAAQGHWSGWHVAGSLLEQAGIGTLAGTLGGLAIVAALNRLNLPTGLHPLLAIAGAVLIYSLAAVLGGSGFLAAYLAGLMVGNRPVRAYASILSLNDAATWLAQIVMFLVLGLLATPHRLLPVVLPSLAIALFLIFVARPVAVWLCLEPFGFDRREKMFVSWVGLRGAVGIFLAIVPRLVHLPHADLYFDVAFFVVLISLVLQGWTTRIAALRLGQALPRVAFPVQRVEIDLPGQSDIEMVGYPILPGSAVLNLASLPRWARAALVIRDETILEPAKAGRLRQGDYAYFLAPASRVARLDGMFAAAAGPLAVGAEWEFSLHGSAPLAELNALYDLRLAPDVLGLTVAQLFAQRFEAAPNVGDSLPLGACTIAVTSLDEDAVAEATLRLKEEDAAPPSRMARLRASLQRALATP